MAGERFLNVLNLVLPLSLGYVAGVPSAPASPLDAKAVARGMAADLPKGVPSDWWASVREDIQQSEYHITWQEQTAGGDPSTRPGQALAVAYQAPNRAHDLRTFFTPEGIRVVPRTQQKEGGTHPSPPWEWVLKLTAYGETLQPVASAQLSVSDNRIEYRRGDLTEWYINDERGLEQGFTLTAPPRSSSSDPQSPIRLELALSGGLAATMSEDGQAIEFSTPGGGGVVMRYGGLHAYDATGRDLPARMEIRDASLSLAVDATSAIYPVTIDPLVSNANWTAESNQAFAYYGQAVAAAGDVNGDGYGDVIVGAPFYDNGQGDEGRVWVYHGSASGLTTYAWRAESNQSGARYGFAVARAGDVNGDGYDDVIVGAPDYDDGQSAEGRVWVYHGSASGLTSYAWRAESNQIGAAYGTVVATAGDINGDGYDDVIVGAPLYDSGQSDEGWVWVYHGSASGLTTFAWRAESNQANAHYGEAVSTAGDVNGDGYDDVIVGAATYDSGQVDEGRVWVYQGSASGLTFVAWSAESNQAYAGYGKAVATAGDVNGDGYGDVIVGAPGYDNGQLNEGRVWVYHGSATGLTFVAWSAESNQANAHYGAALATAGDVNGDGYGDVIVGAHHYDNGQTDEGRVWVYQGSASGLTFVAWSESNQAHADYGWAVSTAGDVNGDGYDDVIIGSPGYDNGQSNEGRAWVYHGPL